MLEVLAYHRPVHDVAWFRATVGFRACNRLFLWLFIGILIMLYNVLINYIVWWVLMEAIWGSFQGLDPPRLGSQSPRLAAFVYMHRSPPYISVLLLFYRKPVSCSVSPPDPRGR